MLAFHDNNLDVFEQESRLGEFVIQVPTVKSTDLGEVVKDIFDNSPGVEGIVVMENNSPVGLIMRTVFFQKIGTLYGHSLYMKRPVSILMDTEIMKVDVDDNISKTSIQAMDREQGKVYDYIIVCNNKTYIGVISIRMFLVEFSNKNEAQVSVLKNQQQKLLNAHKQEIHLRKDLEYQSASVRNLLDHADQGFLSFGKDLIIKNEYSYKCVSIFHKNIENLSYMELINQYFDEEKRNVMEMAFDSFFKNNSAVKDNIFLMLLASDSIINDKNIHFEYRRIESDGEKAIMVILNDITEKIKLEEAMVNDQNKQRLLIKALNHQGQIQRLIGEFYEILSGDYLNYFTENNKFTENLNELFRIVHTFKGDFAQYGFITSSDKIHKLEDGLQEIIDKEENATMIDLKHVIGDVDPEKILEDDLNMIYEVLGKSYFSQSELISFPKSKLEEIENKIIETSFPLNSTDVLNLIRELKYKNIKVFFEQYRDYLQYLSNRVMKNTPIYLIEGDDVLVNPDEYANFMKSLVHIFRNIMDHGIETDEERIELGKAEKGVVECKISYLDDKWFTITISDDGRGIDIDKIKNKAIINNIYTEEIIEEMEEKEIYNLIMLNHFSTKDSTDSISGRGVGMSAFYEACTNLGGDIKIISKKDEGTSFEIKLPCII